MPETVTKKKPAKAKTAKAAAPVVITAYKAFNADWTCRGHLFEIGKAYDHAGKVVPCQSGFHACTVPFDVWSYYPGATALARVTCADPVYHNEDSKVATARLTIEASLTLSDWIKAQAQSVIDLCKKAVGALAGKDKESAAATGNYGHAAATGNYGHAAATGYRGHAAATGNYGHAAATGESGHAAATGNYGHAAATGEKAVAAAIGIDGRAKAAAGGAIMLAEFEPYPSFAIKAVFASKVGENGIKPDTWYRLVDGKPVEVML